ncbi:hypothetical protein BDK51DRAFT_52374 [Blyttiomyces helicus]|uniref:Uncharacterized protein n=1 Tax=Blyttiomyces helicus TaxID=388810 RepID=A0A4P9WJ71_9FUNG|nr:hypothetical protein BDK51DRAFT_52374 [Blyttiomyces helicus]|eukprot:RKO92961.1 hypothetical protein BDK51DRAFT_52374 [Blyttiomyces helicus]
MPTSPVSISKALLVTDIFPTLDNDEVPKLVKINISCVDMFPVDPLTKENDSDNEKEDPGADDVEKLIPVAEFIENNPVLVMLDVDPTNKENDSLLVMFKLDTLTVASDTAEIDKVDPLVTFISETVEIESCPPLVNVALPEVVLIDKEVLAARVTLFESTCTRVEPDILIESGLPRTTLYPKTDRTLLSSTETQFPLDHLIAET